VLVYIVIGMKTNIKEPAATIRAELARRGLPVGWLTEATGMSTQTISRRLAKPEDFNLAELAAISAALSIPPERLLQAWADPERVAS